MDSGTVSGAAEVPNVSPGLDLRTPESLNVNLSEERDSHELVSAPLASPAESKRDVARGEGVALEDEDKEGATNGRTNGTPFTDEIAQGLHLSASDKRKRSISELQCNTTKGDPSVTKRKKRDYGTEDHTMTEAEKEQKRLALLQTIPAKMRKYFAQRHRLFHRYDEGIQLDEEAWYSVTPEKIAAHIANRFAHLKVIVDLYSCVGGNSIQFAKAGMRVIAVEIDQHKINMAKNNAAIYDVEDRIEFRKGDVFDTLSSLRDQFDENWGIFLSPPWGGPSYLNQKVFDVSVFKDAIDKAMRVSSNVAILVPKNTSIQNIEEHFDHCEVEENYLGGKLKTKTLYFGALEGSGATLNSEEF